MFSLRRVVFGVPLLVVASLAAQLVFNARRAGTMVAAHWESATGLVDVTPADSGDARAYAISWRGCSPDSNPTHTLCTFASGMAPRSAVNAERIETVGLDLDVSMLSLVFGATEEECFSGSCTYRPVTSAPLRGTFTIYRGPGSSLEQSNGSTRRDTVFTVYPVYPPPVYPIYPVYPVYPAAISTTEVFSGARTRHSAIFSGTVGLATISPDSTAPNAHLTVMNGQQLFQAGYPAGGSDQ